jgi:hypothetical protein
MYWWRGALPAAGLLTSCRSIIGMQTGLRKSIASRYAGRAQAAITLFTQRSNGFIRLMRTLSLWVAPIALALLPFLVMWANSPARGY